MRGVELFVIVPGCGFVCFVQLYALTYINERRRFGFKASLLWKCYQSCFDCCILKFPFWSTYLSSKYKYKLHLHVISNIIISIVDPGGWVALLLQCCHLHSKLRLCLEVETYCESSKRAQVTWGQFFVL